MGPRASRIPCDLSVMVRSLVAFSATGVHQIEPNLNWFYFINRFRSPQKGSGASKDRLDSALMLSSLFAIEILILSFLMMTKPGLAAVLCRYFVTSKHSWQNWLTSIRHPYPHVQIYIAIHSFQKHFTFSPFEKVWCFQYKIAIYIWVELGNIIAQSLLQIYCFQCYRHLDGHYLYVWVQHVYPTYFH